MVTSFRGAEDNSPKAAPTTEIKRMMEVSTKPNGGMHYIINPSSLDTIQTCLRKSQYVLRDELVSRSPSPAITFGKGIHKALETYYVTPREKRSLPPGFKQKIAMICQGNELDDDHVLFRAAKGFYDETHELLAGLPDEDKRSLANGAWILGEYFESRIHDPYEIFHLDGKPCIETMYQAELFDSPELTVEIHGTIDAILQNKANDSLVICDHKTTSATNMNDFFNRTKPNLQYSSYVWLIKKCTGLDIDNFMINVVQVKPRPKTARGTGPSFLTIMTKRSAEDLLELERSVMFFVRQYNQCLKDDYFPIGTSNACANYGKCDFLTVCESPASIQPAILDANFKKRGAE